MNLEECKQLAVKQARDCCGISTPPRVVVAPYRFNPLGAHIDHQGGDVLARTLDHYTLLVYWPELNSRSIELHSAPGWSQTQTSFVPGEVHDDSENWIRYAQAAAAALNARGETSYGYRGYVSGTLVGAGLSSSASVVLAYLHALADCNNIELSSEQFIETSRQVENEYLGLNNGIQDQMSITFGRANALSQLHMNTRQVTQISDPPSVGETSWVICYSGFDRELIGSGYNTRVAECREAASLLKPGATRLGEVEPALVEEDMEGLLKKLPQMLSRRARHYFTETKRVEAGAHAWATGQWAQFGRLMNESCNSSINNYECGSKPLIDLHEIASRCSGVYGSRFAGGGYGGCLIMLCEAACAEAVRKTVLDEYRALYPDKHAAVAFIATPENGVRVESA